MIDGPTSVKSRFVYLLRASDRAVPKQVQYAIRLMWAVAGVVILQAIADAAFAHPSAVHTTGRLGQNHQNISGTVVLIIGLVALVLYALSWILISKLCATGAQWVRTAAILWAGLALAGCVRGFFAHLAVWQLLPIILLVPLLLLIIGILYMTNSRRFFSAAAQPAELADDGSGDVSPSGRQPKSRN
jgi:hypothetical protein